MAAIDLTDEERAALIGMLTTEMLQSDGEYASCEAEEIGDG